jgi:hypothetical protein
VCEGSKQELKQLVLLMGNGDDGDGGGGGCDDGGGMGGRVDCMLIPVLERLAVQLPLKTGIALWDTKHWPALEGWFVALEN